ncbi:acyl carrier protein [Photorhabdus tasmaniensis]|uniref:acyl carrier protein n=1 Tax=Photorhabdus tasmaniensis TaxID=1004159 RepID=UPI0040415095
MKNKIYEIVKEFSMRDEFSYDEPITNLGIDSMTMIDMILIMEKKLEVILPDEKLTEDSLNSINKIYETISEVKGLV